MTDMQVYKLEIDKIIDELPVEKVEELLNNAAYLGSKFQKSSHSAESGVDSDSLLLQQKSLMKIWGYPGEDIYEL